MQGKGGIQRKIIHFTCKIKTLFAYLEKLLYLCADFWKKCTSFVRFGQENRITYRKPSKQSMTHEQFTQIYLPFSGKMYALAYNLLRNRDEARDCVQDVYSELWVKRDTIEPDKPPLPFVLTMVRNNCLDRLKSRSAQADDETLETLLDHNTENQIEAASDLNAVIQLIDKLPSDQQIILRLRTIDGLEIEQIQELTHFSRENIYTLLSRARKTLKELTAKL